MFCKNCGSSIKDDAEFCAKCGNKTGKMKQKIIAPSRVEMPMSSLQPIGQQNQNTEKRQNEGFKLNDRQKKVIVIVGIAILIVAVIVGIIALIVGLLKSDSDTKVGVEEIEEDYSIVGEWKSEDLVHLADIASAILGESNIWGWGADLAISLFGADRVGQMSLTFTPSGNIYMGIDDISVTIGLLTYEDLGNDKVMLKFDLSDFSIVGTNIPIGVSYTAEYYVDKDYMVLDFFGYLLTFDRM